MMQTKTEDIMIDESNLEQFNFFTSTEIVTDGLITTDEMLQSSGIELSEIRVPLLKFVNEDDIGQVCSRYPWIVIKQLQIKRL